MSTNPFPQLQSEVIDLWKIMARYGVARKMWSARRYFASIGGMNPVGTGNSKTNAAGHYGLTGETCPIGCGQHPNHYDGKGPCYSVAGQTYLATIRASSDRIRNVRSFMAACIYAAQCDEMARFGTSGDIGLPGPDGHATSVDHVLVSMLATVANAVRLLANRKGPIAWGYTHFSDDVVTIATLRDAGLVLRRSGRKGRNGALVLPMSFGPMDAPLAPVVKAAVRKVRDENNGVHVILCPAQRAESVRCQPECGVCWEQPEVTVLFGADGTTRPVSDLG